MRSRLRPSVTLGTILASVGVIVCLLVFADLVGRSRKSAPVNGDAIAAALHAYVKERAGTLLPATVSLRDLISGGYLRDEDVAGLAGATVTVTLPPDNPQTRVLLRAQFPGRDALLVLGDGSVMDESLDKNRLKR